MQTRAKVRHAKARRGVFLTTRAEAVRSMSGEHEVPKRINERLDPQK